MNAQNNLKIQTQSATVHKFRRIGQGFCGTVWSAPTGSENAARAMKREDGGPGRSLHNDYIMHQRVLASLSSTLSRPRISVPECYQYIHGDDQTWWNERKSNFPDDFQPCNTLITDRIPPFIKPIRETLIDTYCPESLKAAIKSSEPDQDCLIRPYLGRRRRRRLLVNKQSPRFQAFSLRNYPLHMDQIEELALDGKTYAAIMAETLAILYWKARIDANDVEFVLAPARTLDSTILQDNDPGPSIIHHPTLGPHALWILDFDCCKPISLDETGVKQAVRAFCRNDPFYPRPGGRRDHVNDDGNDNDGGNDDDDDIRDQTLWKIFKDCFLDASRLLLDQGCEEEAGLAALWVELVEGEGRGGGGGG
ncbi:hypothetical protein MMC09_000931 [Bachmanniomyces sp. S44760]|nr:hypothetical protein [Bachmanniomyces sp. S44760]